MNAASTYQRALANQLGRYLHRKHHADAIVEVEWQTFARSSGIYSPRIDIGVGPFSTISGESQQERYIELHAALEPLLKSAVRYHNVNVCAHRNVYDDRAINAERALSLEGIRYANYNPRCFMAIEIENRVSRKHLLGGALNAAVLGHVGIVVAFNPSVLRAMVRLLAYWDFLAAVGKPNVPTSNLMVLDRDQMMYILGHRHDRC